MTRPGLVWLLVAICGCEHGTASQDPVPEPVSTSGSAIELQGLLPADAVLVGVTIAPDGKRYVLDQRSGLYEVGELSARLVLNITGLNGVELTDVVALDADRLAVTAENDGFLFDLRTGSFSSYFCYLPSPAPAPQDTPDQPPTEPVSYPVSISQTLQLEGISVKQRTESVAFNPGTRQLFAQPRTTRLDTGAVAGSELFLFGEAGGEPIQVLPFADTTFVAGGMVAALGDRLLLGSGYRIFELTQDGRLTMLRQLESSIDITGMARAPNDDLWLLDGVAKRLTRLEGPL